MKKLFFQIGGGFWSSRIMRHYSQKGFIVALTDKDKNTSSRLNCDIFKSIDGNNIKSIISFAKTLSHNYEISKINIAGEFAIPVLAELSKQKFINCISKFKLKYFNNKIEFSKLLKRNNLLLTNSLKIKKIDNIRYFFEKSNSSIVLKPIDGMGGLNVFIVKKKKELEKLLLIFRKDFEIKKQIKKKGFLVENFIDGVELNIYGEMINGKFKIFSAIKKISKVSLVSVSWHQSYLLNAREIKKIDFIFPLIESLAISMNYTKGFIGCGIILKKKIVHFLEIGPFLGLDHLILSDFCFVDKKNKLEFKQDIGKKNIKINIALLAIYNSETVDKKCLKKFNSNYGETKILEMPKKKMCSNKLYGSGNKNIVAFLIAKSKHKEKIKNLFNNCTS